MQRPANEYHGDELAIIGMAGRFPGAPTIEAFWQNLRDGVESIAFFSDEELLAAGVDPALLRRPGYVRAKGALDDVELFDAALFGFTPREAEILDPQQRVFLECAWAALEHAGYAPATDNLRVGVFAGASMSTYLRHLYARPDLVELVGALQVVLGNDKDHLPTRVSYKLNLRGPSVNVQTACSTSLVAVHLACQSLLNGECALALAGGVSITVPARAGYLYQEGGIVSPDGHCRAFDADAQGTLPGNGAGVVVLKRLADAIEDGDTIHAVIKGSAINNDGADKVGYTAPSVQGQAAVIAEALAVARVEPESIGYVEAHGTATPVGDPIEIAALTRVLRARSGRRRFCGIGSVKTNIGHLDAAAGIAGLIKTVLALKHAELPPSLHFARPNPQADLADGPLYVTAERTPWRTEGFARRAGVSSFGMGGTNAHVILEEAPPAAPSGPARPWQLLLLSAKTGAALESATDELADYLSRRPDANLADLAYTLQVGRARMPHRRMLVCRSAADAAAALAARGPERLLTDVQEPQDRPVVFLFPGQGAQYPGMAADLYAAEPVFRAQVDRCAEILMPHLGLDIRDVIYPDHRPPTTDHRPPAAEDRGLKIEDSRADASGKLSSILYPLSSVLEQTHYAQPALFAVEYALAQLWMAWGVRPQAMIGHSIGEYVAATLAGVFSLEDALALVAARGRMMQELPPGAMLAVALPERELRPLLGPRLALAAINGPAQCVVAGSPQDVEMLHEQLRGQGIECQRLHTSHAFHSPMMEPILEQFAELVGHARPGAPRIAYISNVSGTWITAEEATDPRYWARHLRETVRFDAGIRAVLQDPARVLLEVGPGRTLGTLVRQQAAEHVPISTLRHPQAGGSDVAFLLGAVGKLWLAGRRIAWPELHGGERRRRLPLPTYPFERRRYWVEPPARAGAGPLRPTAIDKQADIVDWLYVPAWKRAPLPDPPTPPDDPDDQPPRWLVLLDGGGLGEQLARRLEAAGYEVTTARAGQGFAARGEHAYTLDPRRRDDYVALVAALQARDQLPDRIVHLWGLAAGPAGADGFAAAQDHGFYSLLFLAQTLAAQQVYHKLRIDLIVSGVQEATGEERLCPERATVLGLCKVIPQEYPQITCRVIDVALPEAGTWPEQRLSAQLLAESIAQSEDRAVAYRGPYRYIQTVEPLGRETAGGAVRLREGGVYLITGGLGGVGLALADELARSVRAKLILVGRSALPARDEWPAPAARDDAAGRKIRAIQALERHGAEVLALSADVADHDQMRAVVVGAQARFGALHGVIHAAGVSGEQAYCTIPETDAQVCEAHFRSKVYGLYVLESVLRGVELDFCLLQSSLAATLGGLGFAAYAAANLFMDTFAQRQNQAGNVPWISVNWDAWQLTAAPAQQSPISNPSTTLPFDKLRNRTGLQSPPGAAGLAITPAEGGAVLRRILSTRAAPQVIVSTGDLRARLDRWINLVPLRDGAPAAERGSYTHHGRPALQTAYIAPRGDVEAIVAEIWQEILGIEPIGVYDDFFALGGHSLLVTQIVSRLRETFQVDLPLRSLFEAGTVAGVAAALIAHERAPGQTEKIARVLRRLAGMSDTQAQELLRTRQIQSESVAGRGS